MPRSIAFLALALGLSAVSLPAPARADEVLVPVVLDRKFPQGQFCALPVSLSFTAPTTGIVVTFTAEEFVDDGSGNFVWTEQAVDNVSLATTAIVAANTGGPPPFSSSENCYIGDPSPVTYFYANRPVAKVLHELCDDDPQARGWTYGPRASFDAGRTAPQDVENEIGFAGGSVALGDGSGTPGPGITGSASVIITGLTVGESYDLGAWWYAGFVRFPHDTTYLTIRVETLAGTPVVNRSWGGMKATYR